MSLLDEAKEASTRIVGATYAILASTIEGVHKVPMKAWAELPETERAAFVEAVMRVIGEGMR